MDRGEGEKMDRGEGWGGEICLQNIKYASRMKFFNQILVDLILFL